MSNKRGKNLTGCSVLFLLLCCFKTPPFCSIFALFCSNYICILLPRSQSFLFYSILTNYSPKVLGCSVPHPGTRILENFHSVDGSLLPPSHVIIWKIFPLLGTVWFIERSHLHVPNLIVVDAVDIKGHNKEDILNINTIRIPYFFLGETE